MIRQFSKWLRFFRSFDGSDTFRLRHRLEHHYQFIWLILGANIVWTFLVLSILVNSGQSVVALSWAGALFFLSLARGGFYIYNADRLKSEGQAGRLYIITVAGVLLNGILWSIGFSIALETNQLMNSALSLVILAFLISGSMIVDGALSPANLLYPILLIIPFIFSLLDDQKNLDIHLVTFFVLFFFPLFLFYYRLKDKLIYIRQRQGAEHSLKRGQMSISKSGEGVSEKLRFPEISGTGETFQLITDQLSIGIAITGGDRFLYVNNAFARIFGYFPEEMVEEVLPMDIVSHGDRTVVEALIRAREYLHDMAQHYEYTGLRKDGETIEVEAYAASTILDGQPAYIVSVTEITDRKMIERALKESEMQFRDMFFKHSAVMLLVDPGTGELVDFNERAALFYGFSRSSRNARNMFEIIVPTFRWQMTGARMEGMRSGQLEYHRIANDDLRYVEVHTAPIFVRERQLEFRIIHDVTDRIEYEQERDELIRDLEAFGHTVSHNLRNSLNVIVGRTSLMLRDPLIISSEKLFKAIQTIERSGNRMNEIMSALLLFATLRHSEIVMESVTMDELLDGVLERLVDLIQERKATIHRPESWPTAMGYAPWVEEVWFNYISNAIKYGGDPPVIELGASDAGDGMLKYYVKDNGSGIRAEYMRRLFTPFTRLEEGIRGGHGLGLSIVKRIVEKLNGQTGVDSEGGRGSCFYFTLPAAPLLPIGADGLDEDDI